MPRASTIEQLPPDILEQLQALLRDPRVNQLEATQQINAILENQGHEDRVSKSAVNRYDMKMRQVGDRLVQSRQIADMWIAKIGAQPQGQLGNLVNEMLRTLSFEVGEQLMRGELDEENMPGVIKMLKELSLTTMRLEKASSENVKREREIRLQALEEAAERVEEAAQVRGLSKEDAKFWREQVLIGM